MGKSPQQGSATREVRTDEPVVELDSLEQTISLEGPGVLRHDPHGLTSAPLPRAWILEGNPVARNKRLAGSTDRLASTFMWDCTAGRFNWLYEEDQVVHVLEGSIIIANAGVRQRLQTGDTFHFPAGSRYDWTVPSYVRTIGFSYAPLSRELRLMRRLLEPLKAPFRRMRTG